MTMMGQIPNDEEYEKIKKELEHTELNLRHLYRVFGPRVYELIILSLADIKIDKVNKIEFNVKQ